MSHQNTRGGFSGRYQRPDGFRGGFSGRYQRPDGSRGGFSGRSPFPDGSRGGFSGRSPRPDGHYSHRNRQDGASKPFADENRMSQGRGKHPHHVSTGSGSKHFKDKPASNCVYRPKTPSSDVISNSLEAGGSNMKQPECFEASDSSFALADSKNLHLNDEASKPFAHDFLRTKDGMSQDTQIFSHRIKQPECAVSSDSVCGDDIHTLSGQSDSKNTHLDVIRNQIGETPEKKAEDDATSKADISGKVKVGHMLETLPPAKADDTEDQASQEKGTKNLSSIGDSAHSVTRDGASKPFANQNRMSQGRGKHPHYVYTGSGSKHFKDRPASNCVYRPKTPSPDVISNSLEAGGNNMKQPECFEASDSSFAQADSKNLHLNDDASKPFAHDFLRTKDGMSQGTQIFSHRIKQPECAVSSDSVCGDDSHPLSGQSDSENTHLDVIRNQIGETPEKKAEDGATSKADISGKVKVGHMLETLPPAKADDTEDQASQEKGTNNLSSIGDSGHSVQQAVDKPFDICPPERWNSMLKPSLLEMNKQKRNDIKRSIEGKVQTILGPGMVLLKNYLALSDQVNIVKECRDLGLGPGGFYQPSYRGGGSLHLQMMCLGKNWDPETSKYSDIRPTDGAKPPAIPAEFYKLVGKAIQDSRALIGEKTRERNIEAELPRMLPDICIANFYLATGKLGLHQDKDESQESIDKGLPVVSFSIGDSADFLYGDSRDVDNAQKVTLESGDVLIFGGKSRRIFHGVANIIPATAPKSLPEKTNIRQGRLNLTFRQY